MMNRRHLIGLAGVVPFFAGRTLAQSRESEIVAQLLTMWRTQDWDLADAFIAEDFEQFYPRSDQLPGREAFKQRQAASSIYGMGTSVEFINRGVATTGNLVLAWIEVQVYMFDATRVVAPMLMVMQVEDGMVTRGQAIFDDDVFYDRL